MMTEQGGMTPAAQVQQSCWLIEKPATTEWPAIWLTLTTFMHKYVKSGNHHYTATAEHALKFHDRESAEEYIRHHKIQHVKATEHIFDARAMLQQAAPADHVEAIRPGGWTLQTR